MKRFSVCHGGLAGLGSLAAAVLISTLALAGSSEAQPVVPNRLSAPIRPGEMQTVPGTLHPLTALALDQGQLSGSAPVEGISLVFRRSAAQEADLKNLLQQQQTPGSPKYHQWLKPGQFAARYGVSPADLAKIAAWLQQQGFKIDSIPESRDRIVFSGTAAQVDAAFKTQMHRYLLHGRSTWANAEQVSVPQAIAPMTLAVEHLNTFRPLARTTRKYVHAAQRGASASLKPQYTLQDQNGNEVNFLAPSDSQTIYGLSSLYNNNITGTGQTLAVVGQTDIEKYKSDIQHFRALSGLNSSNLPTQLLMPGTGSATVSAGDIQEADIDVEWSGAIARDASILYVTPGSNQNYSVFDALKYVVQHPLVDNNSKFVQVVSISYGGCEQKDISSAYMHALDSVLEQANAQGQTIVAASGDDGSAQCDDSDGSPVAAKNGLSVNYPASSQYVTAAGGTSFSGDLSDQSKYWNQQNNSQNGSAISYIPEASWNDSSTLSALSNAGSLSSGGGGASAVFNKPTWQTGTGVPADGKRDVPDISLSSDPAHDGYVLCTEETNSSGSALSGGSTCAYPLTSSEVAYFNASGQGYIYGGTSIAAPQLAAMITLWNQKAGNASGAGNVNPTLYQTAQNTPGAFHDITSGTNAVVCQKGTSGCVSNGSGGYVMSCCSAGTGYDMATGLGTVDAAAMAVVWPTISATNPSFSLTASPATVAVTAGSSGTTTIAVTPSGGFTGTVSLACANLPADTTCSFSPASASLTAGKAQNVTITFATTSAASRENPRGPFDRDWPLQTAFAGVFGLALLGFGRKKKRLFPRGWLAALLLVCGLMAATALTACGGGSSSPGSSSPPPTPTPTPVTTTTTVTVDGASGSNSVTVSTKIALTITS